MVNSISQRDVRYIKFPTDHRGFEDLCSRIYADIYHSPGTRRYGRHGQKQSGLDILLHDYRRAVANKQRGIVFVQCKYTEKEDLSFSELRDDTLTAASLVRSHSTYEGVYLFIVATTAQNDSKLHAKLQELKQEHRYAIGISGGFPEFEYSR
jgi:hypothetical protein